MEYLKMDPEVKTKLLAALRSGEYKQAQEYLHRGDGFCCLGVLCDLYRKEKGEGVWYPHIDGREHMFSEFKLPGTADAAFSPHEVNLWAGLSHNRNPQGEVERWENRKSMRKLASLNDQGQSFEEIAIWIEENL